MHRRNAATTYPSVVQLPLLSASSAPGGFLLRLTVEPLPPTPPPSLAIVSPGPSPPVPTLPPCRHPSHPPQHSSYACIQPFHLRLFFPPLRRAAPGTTLTRCSSRAGVRAGLTATRAAAPGPVAATQEKAMIGGGSSSWTRRSCCGRRRRRPTSTRCVLECPMRQRGYAESRPPRNGHDSAIGNPSASPAPVAGRAGPAGPRGAEADEAKQVSKGRPVGVSALRGLEGPRDASGLRVRGGSRPRTWPRYSGVHMPQRAKQRAHVPVGAAGFGGLLCADAPHAPTRSALLALCCMNTVEGYA